MGNWLGLGTIKVNSVYEKAEYNQTLFITDRMAFINQITRRGLATSTAFNAKINEFVVIGGGLMGAGIAQVRSQKLDGIIRMRSSV